MGILTKEIKGLDKTVKDERAYPGTVVITEPRWLGRILGIEPKARIEYQFITGKQTASLSIEMARALLR